MNHKIEVALIALLLSGCALKQYPESVKVSAVETSSLDCPAIEREIAASHNVQQKIAHTGSFDVLTVLGFVGDLGIGNGIAKYRATSKAQERLDQLEALKAARCPVVG
ncbi:hypothetical protein [Pantoea sp. B65]|uniref:hypothetical protein n=1 Tax=Pantoea sp. B65 TaxID=2813359 RepID=UPI0039B47E85